MSIAKDAQQEIKDWEKFYEEKIEAIGKTYFDAYIKPWLIKKQYSFLTGNGTWVVFDPFETVSWAENKSDEMPDHLQAILDCEVYGGDHNLFEFMDGFDYLAYQTNEEGKPS